MAKKCGYDWFSTTANDWGTIHPVPYMPPLLLAEEERPTT
jgi:hypothetical protein